MRDESLQLLIEHQGTHTFLDVNLRGCKAGTIILSATINGETITFPYELRERPRKGNEHHSFTAADVIYLLMPDRFTGTINGIRRQLPYLADLGITTLWLTPVINATSYHGYDIIDFYTVNPRFGTMDDYQALVREAHQLGLKVIMDFVFNHCSSKHTWLQQPPEEDWINHPDGSLITNYRLTPVVDPYAADIDRQQTVEGWFVKTMPDLNLRNRHLLTYLTQCTMWWIETADLDGIRMDTLPYSDHDAMQQWLNTLHHEYPHLHVVGEAWVCNSAFTARMQHGALDSAMDFALFEAFNYAKHEDSNEAWSGLNRIYNTLCYDYLYDDPSMTMAFLDNHDVNRFLENEPQPRTIARLKAALAILLTIPRIPQIYYGTEILMYGNTQQGDNNVRRPFPDGRKDRSHNAFLPSGRSKEEADMHRYLRRLLQWRKNCPAIHHGTTKQFMPYKGIYVIARQYQDTLIVTIVNGNDRSVTYHPERYAELFSAMPLGAYITGKDIITGRTITLNKPFRLAPNKAIICKVIRNK
ncbi:MAG: cyclomaltodextrinase C-terminal domain-containing protein [Prevotella sp.]|nr:cyclomaltodextrinase C-terminal domain-containing protein [Candidatus Prevotella equi]